ncbi:D-isomer specific 2-hydroxyacid dehydrogenase NAD-binding [Methylobacterium sp. 4-46]|uniref:2-hydroxyacid dehydrogenase n=1 Tax=unclassified Methylobacterium TaxID=2615210 RepID=UPI000165C67F|nr:MULTISPECIES: glyoxylate/hydroxypyruvate reductase A [Methylobacterium]ACA15227.1 D-isomer specific 2-hydroxyacid dehydrogenase NAD-binding [Methylobacterium sp. 4-46]WFT80957.1 glyoxylate/hydroxypyruvate reductase A [Methylobacterium nodulans]
MTRPIPCILLSETLDLAALFGPVLAQVADAVEVVTDPAEAARVRLALAWFPPADAFARYPNLGAVCSIAAGVDSLLACPGLPPDLPVVRVVDPDQARAMSCFVLWHVLGHLRRFRSYAENQARALWRPLGQRAAGEVTVGLLGCGRMGAQVARDLAAFGFPVLAWSRAARPAEPGITHLHGPEGLAALLPRCDVLVNLLPLTPDTRGLLAAPLFGRLKPGAALVHVGRGDHLVEADLLCALDSGRLAHAALDVFAVEPLPEDHPFWRHPRILVTPHEACDASPAAVAAMLRATAEALRTGAPIPHAIDRRRGY